MLNDQSPTDSLTLEISKQAVNELHIHAFTGSLDLGRLTQRADANDLQRQLVEDANHGNKEEEVAAPGAPTQLALLYSARSQKGPCLTRQRLKIISAKMHNIARSNPKVIMLRTRPRLHLRARSSPDRDVAQQNGGK